MEKNNLSKDTPMSFEELIDLARWKKIQDTFSSITGIGIRTLDSKGKELTQPSGEPRACREFLQRPHIAYNTCETCLPTFLGGDGVVDRNLAYLCPPGLHNFIAPLGMDENNIVAYVVMGPVILVSRKPKEYYTKMAEELNADPENFWNAILEIRVLSYFRVQAIVELIKEIGAYILELAYRSKSIAAEIDRAQLLLKPAPKLVGIMDKFLNVALHVSGADIGSIMMMDPIAGELTIRASRGLPPDVVKKTRVRIGEGISGTAVKENKHFLIDSEQADNRIKPYLNRPQIRSSMVLPIKIQDETLGVLNLASLEASPVKFDSKNITSMSELIELADLALSTPR